MPEVTLPSPQFNLSVGSGIAAGGFVYIGLADEDPTIEANRIDVTVIDIDGSPVVIGPESQPFELNSAAMFTYNGSVVQLRTDQDYSMQLQDSSTNPIYYFPSATSATDVSTSILQMTATGVPTAIPGVGQLFTQSIGGGIQLMYLDPNGNVIQISNNGNLNVDLPNDDLTANSLFGNYFRGNVVDLAIVAGEVDLDWTAGQYFTFTNTEDNVWNFSEMPLIGEGIGQTIMIALTNGGAFTIDLNPEVGYDIYTRSIDQGKPFTVSGLDLVFVQVYAENKVMVVALYDWVTP